ADLFEIKDVVRDRSAQIVRSHTLDRTELCFSYRNDVFEAQTRVTVDPPASTLDGDDLVWTLELVDDAVSSVEVTVPFEIGPDELVPARTGYAESEYAPPDDPPRQWSAEW